jgi:Ca2+-binding RTX toxin-like protein
LVDRIVTDNTSLNAALKAAGSGDRILLAAGNYTAVSISGMTAPGVEITSQDASHEAVLSGLTVANSSGLTIDHLEVAKNAAPGTYAYAVTVSGSSNVTLSDMNIHGSMDGDPTNDMNGVKIAGSTNVTFANSEVQQFLNGMAIGGSSNVTISHNNYHDIRIDGVDVTTTKGITIDGNQFHDFHHLAGDHADAIQFFTLNQPGASSDITITNNEIYQGSGVLMQGIFITDGDGNLPFSGVDIENNVVLGGNWNSIEVSHATDAKLVNNYATALNVINSATGTPMLSQVVLQNVDTVTMTGNHASVYVYGGMGDTYFSGNTLSTAIGSDQAVQATADHLLSQIQGQNLSAAQTGTPGQIIFGTDAADSLVGTSANDTEFGGAGNDTLKGGSGADHLVGGDGADVFLFQSTSGSTVAAPDTIADFSHAEGDLIDLSGISKTFSIVKYFDKHPNELTITFNVDHQEIRGDVNGDGIVDFQINVDSGKTLLSSDFIF